MDGENVSSSCATDAKLNERERCRDERVYQPAEHRLGRLSKKKKNLQSSVYICGEAAVRSLVVKGQRGRRGQSQGDFFIRNCGATVALDDSRGTDIGVKSE